MYEISMFFNWVMMPEPAFRMLHYGEFHAAEMSLSWYAMARSRDPWRLLGARLFLRAALHVPVSASSLSDGEALSF